MSLDINNVVHALAAVIDVQRLLLHQSKQSTTIIIGVRGFPRTRLTKGPVRANVEGDLFRSVRSSFFFLYLFLSFFLPFFLSFFSSFFLLPSPRIVPNFFVRKSNVLGRGVRGPRGGRGGRGGRWKKKKKKLKK